MAYTTINKGSDYFNTVLYTGNSSTNAITGVGFQPDFTWFKRRDSTAAHSLINSVTGVTKRLASNLTDVEITLTDALTSFDSDGFTLGIDAGNYINYNSATYASWSWLAGGTSSSNTDGSITSSVSANTTNGLSIVSYTGTGSNATIGHGLGVAPKMVIAKGRSNTGTWSVYHEGIGNAANGVSLENTSGSRSEPAYWNSTAPTSSVFSVGTSNDTNGSSRTYIAYCFAEKKGFSKFGSYTGNGSTDGAFVYTGFKPAFVIMKRTDTSASWFMKDNKRDPFNPVEQTLASDSASSEAGWGTGDDIDLLSNGFKMKDNSTYINASGGTYIYMAFAEHPFVSSTGTPTTAR